MLEFFKKLFGSKPVASAPYKVEAPKPDVAQFPFPEAKKPTVKKATTRAPKADSKPAVKAKTARKPKTPKA